MFKKTSTKCNNRINNTNSDFITAVSGGKMLYNIVENKENKTIQ